PKDCGKTSLLRRVSGKKITSNGYPRFRKPAGNVPQRLQTSYLLIHEKAAKCFDPGNLIRDNQTDREDPQQRYGQQQRQASRDRHDVLFVLQKSWKWPANTVTSSSGSWPEARPLHSDSLSSRLSTNSPAR